MTRAAGFAALAAGLAVWVVVQGVLVGVPLRSRGTPPEIDDAYTYIAKSVQMTDCFLQDCPAMNDLRGPLRAPTSDPEIRWRRYRAYARAFLVAHPLYSVGLIAVKSLGVSWERAYMIVWAAGPILFGLAFAYWLSVLWGPAAAGAALFYLAFQVFPGQGLHYVVPSNLTLAVAVWVWARLVKTSGDAPWSLPLGTCALLLTHPAGRLYAAAALALGWFLGPERPSGKRLVPYILAVCAIVAATLLPHVVRRPELSVVGDAFGTWRQTFVIPYFTLEKVVEALDRWSGPFGSLIAFGVLLAAGFAWAPARRQRALAATALVLAGLVAVSFAYVLPRYPAELFMRVWVPFAVFMTGALGHAVVTLLAKACDLARAGLDASRPEVRLGEWRPSPTQGLALALVCFGTFAGVAAKAAVAGCATMRTTIVYMRDRHSLAFDAEQPKRLLREAAAGDRVLYMQETPMLFFLTHGANALGAVFHPAVAGTLEAASMASPAPPAFAVAQNPVMAFPRTPRGWVRLSGFRSLEVRPPAGAPGGLRLRLENPAAAASLRVAGRVVDVPSGFSGWLSADVPPTARGGVLALVLPEGSSELALGGLAFGDDPLFWPWESKAVVTLLPGGGAPAVSASFDLSGLLPAGADARVLDDRGTTVLARLGPRGGADARR
ncbi:MAG: hypothetical protein HYZ75_10615 [Elusimicrobia bacterium]|nr:hypothetical protein [Elusimicrobiota bacterium]